MDNDYITAVEVCYMLGVAQTTLSNWYKWYKTTDIDCPPLPMPCKIKNRNYWHRDDMDALFTFKKWIPKGRNGVMGSVNRKYFTKKHKD